MSREKSKGRQVANSKNEATGSDDPDDPESIEEILSKLPKNTPPEVREYVTQAFFSGPLPPPALLEHYEHTLPGLADRIATMAEKEQQIRSGGNKWILVNDTLRVFGSLLVSLALIGQGFIAGLSENPGSGAHWAHRAPLLGL